MENWERERERRESKAYNGKKRPKKSIQPDTTHNPKRNWEREREIQRFLHGRKKEYCEFDYLEHLYRVAN